MIYIDFKDLVLTKYENPIWGKYSLEYHGYEVHGNTFSEALENLLEVLEIES